MKGVKIAASIVAMVEGISGIISGIMLTVMGVLWKPVFGEIFSEASSKSGYDLNWLTGLYTWLYIVLGVYILVLSILNLVFAIKFRKDNPESKTTITLLVFSILIGNVPAIALLIVYLVLSGKQQDQNQNSQESSF